MNKFCKHLVLGSGLVLMASCGGSSSNGHSNASDPALASEQTAIIKQVTDAVIVPTYKDLATKSLAMKAASDAFAAAPTQGNFTAARAAWTAARIPWEQSEAFLFGPVEQNSYDPKMDSWPLDHEKLTANIAINAATPVTIDSQDAGVKGFHAIEFIYWGYTQSKTNATQVTADEISYLKGLTDNHAHITTALANDWTTAAPNYANTLKTGGTGSMAYASTHDAVEELLNAMVGIASEVGRTKIAGPATSGDADSVESQFSYNSLADFQNNIKSVQNVYYGSLDGTTVATSSFSSFVAVRNANLDAKVKASISGTITAIGAIPEPFRNSINNPAAKPAVDAAIRACADLRLLLDTEVRAIVLP
ncbi:MAG: peptidase M75 [Chitinophagaceae bacterium]|nr:peptidase M75 [Oligoflexus sp.]